MSMQLLFSYSCPLIDSYSSFEVKIRKYPSDNLLEKGDFDLTDLEAYE